MEKFIYTKNANTASKLKSMLTLLSENNGVYVFINDETKLHFDNLDNTTYIKTNTLNF